MEDCKYLGRSAQCDRGFQGLGDYTISPTFNEHYTIGDQEEHISIIIMIETGG